METPIIHAGKSARIKGADIAGIVSCIPKRKIGNDYFVEKFGEPLVNDIVKMIGVENRRWVDENTSTRDLCASAGRHLLKELDWDPASVDAIIFISQTPDYRLPATACVLQSDLGLPTSCIAFDINLGCSGYPYALWLGMTIIQSGAANRVLLAIGDTISRIVDPDDRATAMLFGDAGTMTALESSDQAGEAFFILGTDGSGVSNLIVPTGAFKDYPASGDERLSGKKPECLFMDGGDIFNFTLKAVPPLVNDLMAFSGQSIESTDVFLFHQANLFMLKHLAKKAKIPMEKLPVNIDDFGNTSSASIPLLMSTRLASELKTRKQTLAMFGFGVGYSWAAAELSVGPVAVVETIEL